MANLVFYSESVDGATFTVNSLGSDTNYPATNLNDRNKNVYWKAANANTSGYIEIDLGENRTVDYIILGFHNYTDTSVGIKFTFDMNNDGNFTGEYYLVGSSFNYEDYVTDNSDIWLETFTAQGSYRYYRLYLEAMGAGTYQQLACLFLGTAWEHSHSPELGVSPSAEYLVDSGITTAGIVRTQINNTTVKKYWNYIYKYVTSSEKTNFETWRDNIYISSGLSHYPFFFKDSVNQMYYVRNRGVLKFMEHAYDVWQTEINFEQEL